MGSLFVNPLMLLGATAIIAPIVLFLLTRFRYRTVEWAALVFLQRALKREQRRLRLENLLLLLIRCLILILFALVLARPRSQARVEVDSTDKRDNVVILLDTSFSTGYQIGSDEAETSFERERRAVKDIIAGLRDGDRVILAGFDETLHEFTTAPRNMNKANKEGLQNELEDADELRLSARGTDLGEALHTLPRILVRFEPDGLAPPDGQKPLQKTVFLLTDAQRRGLLDSTGSLQDGGLKGVAQEIEKLGGSLVLVDCGADDPRNASISRLATRELVVGQDLPCHIEVGLRNWSLDAINDLTVEYFVDGAEEPQKVLSISLPGGEEVSPEPLRYVFREAGPHRVAVHLSSDALAIDNWRHLVIDVRKSVRLLLVDGEPSRDRWDSETDFLKEVLALSEFTADDGLGLLRPEVVDEAGLSSRKLEDYDVVVLANLGQIEDELGTRLEAYARGGGAVVFTLGAQAARERESWNQVLWRNGLGILPCELGEMRGGTLNEAQADPEAPAWAMSLGRDRESAIAHLFGNEEMFGHLRLPSIYGFVRATLPVEAPKEGAEDGGDRVAPAAPGSDRPSSVALQVVPRRADDGGVGPTPAPSPNEEETGQPLLVERPFGRGRAVIWLSSCDYAWNNCVLFDGFYVPFWRQLVLDLAQRVRPAVNLPLGGRFERLLRPEEYSAQITVDTPRNEGRHENIQATKLEGQEMYRLVYPPLTEPGQSASEVGGTDQPGLYTITRQQTAGGTEPAPDYFAVTIDPSEGDLAKYSAEELTEALGTPVRVTRPELAREVLSVEGGVGGAQEYWKHVLVAVLLLLALESILAAAFGRRRR